MHANALRKALLKNKYFIVKRTLRLTEHPINETGYADFDDDASLDAIEAQLKMRTESTSTDNHDSWFRRLFRW